MNRLWAPGHRAQDAVHLPVLRPEPEWSFGGGGGMRGMRGHARACEGAVAFADLGGEDDRAHPTTPR